MNYIKKVAYKLKTSERVAKALHNLRDMNPLVHHITNYVTANDSANITLAIGASPIMADDIHEVRDVVTLSDSLVINLGTLNRRRLNSMMEAMKKANKLGIPVVLDPVGVGAIPYRRKIATDIMDKMDIAVVRGNLSEIKALYGFKIQTKGVDTSEVISTNKAELSGIKRFAKHFANKFDTVVAITGRIDVITNGKDLYLIKNGHEMMSKITGTGCMCTSLIGSYIAAGERYLYGTIAGVLSMGIAGEIGQERLMENESTGSLKMKLIDVIYNLSEEEILKRGKIYEE